MNFNYKNYPFVFAIALSFNDDRKILKSLNSILESDYPNLKVLFLDNGSKFDLTKTIKKNFPSIMTIRLETNRGFAGGMNYGMQYLNAQKFLIDYYCLISNDGYVKSKTLAELISIAEKNPKVGILGPEILLANRNGKHDAWLNKESENNPARFSWNDETFTEGKELIEVGYVRGPCILVRNEMAKTIGLMRSGFHLYWEEVEWQWRGKCQGWLMAVCPGSIVYHDHESYIRSFENPINTFYRTRNEIFFNRLIMTDQKGLTYLCFRNIAGIIKNGLHNCKFSWKTKERILFLRGIFQGLIGRIPPIEYIEG